MSDTPELRDDDRDPFAEVSEDIKTIHKLMFPISFKIIYPETEMENGFEIAKRIDTYVHQQQQKAVREARKDEVKRIPLHWETCYDNAERRHYQKISDDYVEKRLAELERIDKDKE